MWKEFLSSIGVGSARVDTIISEAGYQPGQTIDGFVKIIGGSAKQQIASITITLCSVREETRGDSDFSYIENEHQSVELKEIGMIHEGEERKIPFQIPLSADHPQSSKNMRTILRTSLSIQQGVDSSDEDEIFIRP